MATNIRPTVTTRNKYHIDTHRSYELRHFCLQYPMWRRVCAALDGMLERPGYLERIDVGQKPNPTESTVMKRDQYLRRMGLIEECAKMTDPDLAEYILKGVTEEGCSYVVLKMKYGIPCSRSTYFDRYRKFFWLLDKARE